MKKPICIPRINTDPLAYMNADGDTPGKKRTAKDWFFNVGIPILVTGAIIFFVIDVMRRPVVPSSAPPSSPPQTPPAV